MSAAAAPVSDNVVRRSRPAGQVVARRRSGTLALFLLVFGAELAFGTWMAARGFRWGDAMSRSASALAVLHSADPQLANIGFVWPPLPTLLDLIGAVFYPLWPGIVSSGVSAALTTAACAGATAVLLLVTARRLGLSTRLGWVFALLVAANPMLFLYGSNGMPEGVAVPCLTGAVCFLTLFWASGERLWIAAAGTALALGFAAVYQGLAYGAALYVALVGGVLWSSEARASTPQGRGRAVEGLGLLLLTPAAFVGLLWIGANAVIMGDPLDFMHGAYGYSSFQEGVYSTESPNVGGDIVGALGLVGGRSAPFTIPLAFVLLVRLVDGRFWRFNTLSASLIAASVPLGMVVPMAFLGSPMGYLRYLVYPLFVAAGWGLYEIAMSRRRRTAVALILTGWLLAFPASVLMMSSARFGLEEKYELKGLVEGLDGGQTYHKDPVRTRAPIAAYLDAHVLSKGGKVLFDSFLGAPIAMQIDPAYARQLVLTYDSRFKTALAYPSSHDVGYFLVPDPGMAPQDAIVRVYPRLWDGRQPGFRLVKTLVSARALDQSEKWRLYAVRPGARPLPGANGGTG